MTVAFGLIILAILLFIAVKRGLIHGDTIELGAKIGSILAFLAAVAVFIFPAATSSDPTPFPTSSHTPINTVTLSPTPTVTKTPTNTPIPSTNTPISPTDTPIVSPPTQTPSSPSNSQSSSNQIGPSGRRPPVPAPLGWAYEQDNVQLNLIKAEIRTGEDSQAAAAYLHFALVNKSSQEILVEFNHSNIYIIDAMGQKYEDWYGPEIETFRLEPNEFKVIARYYSRTPGEKSRIPPSALPVIIHADELSRVQNAQWIVGNSPIPTYATGDSVRQLGQAFSIDSFDVTLVDLEIRTTSDSQPAAFRAWFSARNTSTQQQLLIIDYAYIYIEDNFGNRYIDWEGAGVVSTWVEPGEEFNFDRYYSVEYEEKSRVPIGTTYAVVIVEGVASGTRAQWRIDIVR